MGLFGRFGNNSGASKENQKRQREQAEQTLRALESGQIPQYVRDRIEAREAQAIPWTSDLGVSDFLLLKQYKLQPLGMVMGSSIYHIGYTARSFSGSWQSGFIPSIEQALLSGRELALQRMKQEAQLMGAHAVVGVQLKNHIPDVNSHETEFTAFGTAVVLEGKEPPSEPILCTVSASDFVKLIHSGSVPISVGLGVAAFYQYTTRQDNWQSRSWSNQEMLTYTDSVYETRHAAMSKLRQQISQLGGTGILAHETNLGVYEVEVERGENDERTDHILEFIATGTIVSSVHYEKYPHIETVLSLNKQKPRPQYGRRGTGV
ncbi:heavy metal-binding domain-containing protein [Alicyclobacillus sp. SO9]|uniref:heavy metal-binding domain-containing protein n=1 Tax=Alicyclobacillus sp. SO9 TaxID=2665646 RepID=UPI0018E7D572|nr:heavy metal-binding domain-containing protein [Alicyclobacillus sp. SO9]QQE79009.1 heavy metal-binding domain-containing protein [Alicyclobacillus sp. SO9]